MRQRSNRGAPSQLVSKGFKRRSTREELGARIDLCHSAIHVFEDHRTPGREYNTLERLRAHPEVAKFTAWVRHSDAAGVRSRRG